ncbi:MAG: DNA-binding domain-containing protein [Parabacteroides sp.]
MAKNAITVDLYDNVLTEKKGDYTGKVSTTGSADNQMVADEICKERTEYRPETIMNILDLADKKRIDLLASGKTVNTGLGVFSVSVSGSFDGESAQFDPAKHKLSVGFSASGTMRKALSEVDVKTRAAAGGITINSVYDPLLDETNGRITSGSNLVINGVNIKIAGENPANGVFFSKVGSSEQKKVRLLVHNNPSQLTVLLPTLEPGDYQLTVTTQAGTGGKMLKEPRSYTFTPLLTVELEDDGYL